MSRPMSAAYRILVTGATSWDDAHAVGAAITKAVLVESLRRGDTGVEPGPTNHWAMIITGAGDGAEETAREYATHPAWPYPVLVVTDPAAPWPTWWEAVDVALVLDRDGDTGTLAWHAWNAGVRTVTWTHDKTGCEHCGCPDRYGCPLGMCTTCPSPRGPEAEGVHR